MDEGDASTWSVGQRAYIRYVDEPAGKWQCRLLCAHVGASEWATLTPDGDVYIEDFSVDTNAGICDVMVEGGPCGGRPRRTPNHLIYNFPRVISEPEVQAATATAEQAVAEELERRRRRAAARRPQPAAARPVSSALADGQDLPGIDGHTGVLLARAAVGALHALGGARGADAGVLGAAGADRGAAAGADDGDRGAGGAGATRGVRSRWAACFAVGGYLVGDEVKMFVEPIHVKDYCLIEVAGGEAMLCRRIMDNDELIAKWPSAWACLGARTSTGSSTGR